MCSYIVTPQNCILSAPNISSVQLNPCKTHSYVHCQLLTIPKLGKLREAWFAIHSRWIFLQQMVASSVRTVNAMREGALSDEVQQLVGKNPSLQQYIRYVQQIPYSNGLIVVLLPLQKPEGYWQRWDSDGDVPCYWAKKQSTLAAWCLPCSVHICYVFVCVWCLVFRLARNLNLIRACGVRILYAYS